MNAFAISVRDLNKNPINKTGKGNYDIFGGIVKREISGYDFGFSRQRADTAPYGGRFFYIKLA